MKRADVVVNRGELRRRGEEDDPEEAILRLRAEAGPVDAEHAGRAQEPEHVVLVGPPGGSATFGIA